MKKSDIVKAVSSSIGFPLRKVFPAEYINDFLERSQGNPILTEHEVSLMFDCGYIKIENNDVQINPELRPEIKIYKLEELLPESFSLCI